MAVDDLNPSFPTARETVERLPLERAPEVAILLCWGSEYKLFSPQNKADEAGVNQQAQMIPDCAVKDLSTQAQPPLFYRLDSMLDVARHAQLTPGYLIYRALRAYFDNGGSYCYVVNQNDQAQAVGCLPDATLIVEAGTWANLDAHAGKSLLVIMDSNIVGEMVLPANKRYGTGSDLKANCALYGPWLKADWSAEAVPPSAAVAGLCCKSERNDLLASPLILNLQGGLAPLFVSSDFTLADCNGHAGVHIIQTAHSTHALGSNARSHGFRGRWLRVTILRLWGAFKKMCPRSWPQRCGVPTPTDATVRLRTLRG